MTNEERLLACCFQYPETADLSRLRPEDFGQLSHMFEAFKALRERGETPTLVSLAMETKDNAKTVELFDVPVSSEDYERLESAAIEKSEAEAMRKLGEALKNAPKKATAEELKELAHTSMHALARSKKRAFGLDEEVFAYQTWLEEKKVSKTISWGPEFSFLDDNTDGIQKKKTYRIGANSNVGKTQFVYKVLLNVARQKKKALFFTLENEKETTLNYLMASLMKVNSRHLAKGSIPPAWDALDEVFPYITIVDDCNELSKVFAKVEAMKPDVVFLDYIGLCRVKGATTEGKYAEYAERVPPFVKSKGISWVDLSNLPKNSDSELIKQHGEFYGSSLLKNNLDVGIHFTYNKKFYDWKEENRKNLPPGMENKQVLDMRLTKNRLGPVGLETTYVLDFDKGGAWRQATKEEETRWSF